MKKKIISFLYKLIEKIEKIEYRNIDLNEDDISKKIISTYNIKDENLYVMSDTGYVPISDIHITQPYTHYEIILENNMSLKCADNHIVFDENLNEIFVKNLKIGNYIKTEKGNSKVKYLKKLDRKTSMVDLTINNDNHRYYTNGILSHNTISAAIYILHFMLFNNTKNVLLAANILDTSKEVLDKIKAIYSYIPFFLQQGIENWSVTQIRFQNKCRAKAFAMTKNASIGNAGDLVYIDEFAHIENKVVNKFYKSIFPTLASLENSKMLITSTPNGYNLFHDLVIDSEREETDPLKNSFASLRVYWYQVPGRNVTYLKINEFTLSQNKLTLDSILNQCIEKYNPNDEVTPNGISLVQLKRDPNNNQPWIWIQNTDNNKYEDIRNENFIDLDGNNIHVSKFSVVSTWKLDQIKDIGGLDNFNQEFDLRFSAGSKSVLSEQALERITDGKKKFKHIDNIDIFKKLRWDYSSLKFIEDFDESIRKKIYVSFSIDISEGLGQDYSVINLFKLQYKPIELILKQKDSYKSLIDFFQLDQFGIFRSNIVSHEQLAEITYLLMFEFFDDEKVKGVVEYNNDGKAFLSEIKNVFERENDYSGHIMLKFKHRVDSPDKKIGLKVGLNKNKFVKDYQDRMERQDFIVHDENTIKEIGTFIKHVTPAGNTVYKGDGGNDDCAMTIVNLSQGWKNTAFKELVQEYHENSDNRVIKDLIDEILHNEIKVGTDYNSFFKAKNKAIGVGGRNRLNPKNLI